MSGGGIDRLTSLRRAHAAGVEEAIDDVVARAGLRGSTLARMLDYQMETGGKRLRAILPLRVADALENPPESLVAFGAACELIHNATLIHDDLQDGDRMRRGQPAVWAEFGKKEAINLGDAILYLAPLCLEAVDVDSSLRWEVTTRMCRRVLELIDGQQGEFELAADSADFEDYERVVAGKTGGLFALPIAEGARLCGESQPVVEALDDAAHRLGVLFQIQDDLLDLYGEKGRSARGGDLREGKVSALVVAFQRRTSVEESKRLVEILRAERREVGDDEIVWAADRFRQSGAVDFCLKQIDELHHSARTIEPIAERPALVEMIDELVELVLQPIDSIT